MNISLIRTYHDPDTMVASEDTLISYKTIEQLQLLAAAASAYNNPRTPPESVLEL